VVHPGAHGSLGQAPSAFAAGPPVRTPALQQASAVIPIKAAGQVDRRYSTRRRSPIASGRAPPAATGIPKGKSKIENRNTKIENRKPKTGNPKSEIQNPKSQELATAHLI